MMIASPSFARFVAAPENRAALCAVQDLAGALNAGRTRDLVNPLYLHGPTGTGKTHLVSALVNEVRSGLRHASIGLVTAAEPASGLDADLECERPSSGVFVEHDNDLLIIEDLQRLAPALVERFIEVLDQRQSLGLPTVVTAATGPRQLCYRGDPYPARLTSRLAAGLVISLAPLGPASRLAFLIEQAQRRQLAVGRGVLNWLADHLSGGTRQLEGAIILLERLSRLQGRPLTLTDVESHFRVQADASRPTVERIAQRVGGAFQVDTRQLLSRRRLRSVLLPRQISMYLARRLTPLSLDEIGAYFGGRDHSTVLHACRKVQKALADDAVLSGTVQQLHAELA